MSVTLADAGATAHATTRDETTVEKLCEEAYREKIAEHWTWNYIWNNIKWGQFIPMVILNVGLVGSLTMYAFGLHSIPVKPMTVAWIFIVGCGAFVGTTAGAHRLWSHRSYKANLPLRILLMFLYSVLGLYTIYDWARDHRVHHKYVETDADPHNAKRGFWFSHMGWLCVHRHPECLRRGREVDMTDVRNDGVAMFQRKYGTILNIIFCFTLPTIIPVIYWGETVMHAVLTQVFIRYVLGAHCLWSINSFAHLWGDRPYNRLINPAENMLVSVLTGGEGSHNYHHTFPWDYKASELPYINFNAATMFIDAFARIGWAYDLRQPSPELIDKIVHRIGKKSTVPVQHQQYWLFRHISELGSRLKLSLGSPKRFLDQISMKVYGNFHFCETRPHQQ